MHAQACGFGTAGPEMKTAATRSVRTVVRVHGLPRVRTTGVSRGRSPEGRLESRGCRTVFGHSGDWWALLSVPVVLRVPFAPFLMAGRGPGAPGSAGSRGHGAGVTVPSWLLGHGITRAVPAVRAPEPDRPAAGLSRSVPGGHAGRPVAEAAEGDHDHRAEPPGSRAASTRAAQQFRMDHTGVQSYVKGVGSGRTTSSTWPFWP